MMLWASFSSKDPETFVIIQILIGFQYNNFVLWSD